MTVLIPRDKNNVADALTCHELQDGSPIWELLSWNRNVSVTLIPRDKNNVADALARYASRDGSPRRVWKLPRVV